MSRQHEAHNASRARGARRLHVRSRVAAVTMAVAVGLAACGGDDDDAAESTAAPESSAAAATVPESTLPTELTDPPVTTAPDASDDAASPTVAETQPAESDASATEADGTAADPTDPPEAAAAAVSETSAPDEPSGTDGAGPEARTAQAGPTTTGPPCEFAENSSLPLERCDMGPAVAVVQSRLQAEGYAIDTIDGNFGDQTLAAVRAFQEDEALKVDGIVGLQTWTALDVSQFGADQDGDGVIEPNEIDLS